jgi:asparagine synthase (glutamine-hydrolysing)
MCGFAVVLRRGAGTSDLSATIARMVGAIRHRGPDDEGTYFAGPLGMGFRRLSILDMSPLGHQPMLSDDGQVVLVFNGEIYNYLELRGELQALGHRFKSTGDSEVLLRAYLEWGTDCVSRFNGMWAFIIHDARTGSLFGSRDRFGIKPLYRYSDDDHFLFGSEIKAIRVSGLYRGGTNWQVARRYLLDGRLDTTPETFYTGIEQIAPSTSFEVTREGAFKQWRYWSVHDESGGSVDDPAIAFADLFEDAVRLHMRSDVPVGVHLSGGLDSTAIICAAARIRTAARASGPLMAYSYIAREFDETRYINDTIEQTAANLVKLHTDPVRLWELLREVLWFQDEPMHSMTPVVGYELMRRSAADGIKVILNGQGADETIAGYRNYFNDYWCTLITHGRIAQAWREIGRYVAVHGGNQPQLFMRQWRRLAQSQLAGARGYRRLANWNRRRVADQRWFTHELSHDQASEDPGRLPTDLNASLARSIYRDPLPLYLRLEDRNSMAHSVEARLPFLDYRLVCLLFTLPAEWRLRGPWNKYVLREAMRGRIPESVRTRIDKMGFPVPARNWFADTLNEPALEMVNSRAARERGIYNTGEIVKDIERHRRGEIDATAKIFKVAQFEAWCAL